MKRPKKQRKNPTVPEFLKLEEKVKKLSDKLRLVIDTDNDGLSDYQEKFYGTDPDKPDTDDDGLSDYEEIKIYQTNPRKSDTDNDGVSDGAEVRAGSNPRGRGRLKDLFFAYAGNDYSPGLLQTGPLAAYGAAAVVLKVVLVLFTLSLPLSAWVTPDLSRQQADKIINLTNAVRENLGLNRLTENEKLNNAADAKAQDMLLAQYFSHLSPARRGLNYWLEQNNYVYTAAGENLALGFADAAEVINAWSQSPTHYANLTDPGFSEIGVGVASGRFNGYDTTLVAQFFGAPTAKPAAAPVSTGELAVLDPATAALSRQVFGEKIVAARELAKPELISPVDGYLSASQLVDLRVYAAGAESLLVYLNGEPALEIGEHNNYNFEFSLELREGENQLRFKANQKQQSLMSDDYRLTLDTIPPEVDLELSKLAVEPTAAADRQLVRAVVYLSADTADAKVNFGNYQLVLRPDETTAGKWTGSGLVFERDAKQLFNPAVLPVVTATDRAGNLVTVDISWEDVLPAQASLTQQYFLAKNSQTPLSRWLFAAVGVVYQAMLALVAAVLLLNLFRQIQKRKSQAILVSLSVIALLAVLIVI